MESTRRKITTAAVLLMALAALEQFTGLLKQMLVASLFGTSETMDAFLVAAAIIGIIRSWVSHPIDQAIIPMFRHDLARHGEKISWANVSILFNNLALILGFIALIGWLVAPYLIQVMAPGFAEVTRSLATSLTRITMGAVVFLGMERVLSQMLFSYERFSLPGVGGSVENVAEGLVLLVFAGTYGIYGMAIALVMGTVSRFIIQLPILWEKRKFYVPRVNLYHPGMTELGKLSFPLLIATSGDQVARITDRVFASLLAAGSLSALNYAQGLMSAMNSFFIGSFQQSTFPHFSKLSAEEQFSVLSRQLFHYLRIVFFFTVPMAVGVMVVADGVIRVVYQRGAFDEGAVSLTSRALFFYAIGFPAQALARILNRTFFSLKETWIPSKLALLRIGIKILLSWLLIRPLGHIGIALAESISHIIRVFFLFAMLPKEVKGEETWSAVKSFGETLVASIVMGAAVYFVNDAITGILSLPLELAGLVLLGTGIYTMTALLSRREEFYTLLGSFKSIFARYLPTKS